MSLGNFVSPSQLNPEDPNPPNPNKASLIVPSTPLPNTSITMVPNQGQLGVSAGLNPPLSIPNPNLFYQLLQDSAFI